MTAPSPADAQARRRDAYPRDVVVGRNSKVWRGLQTALRASPRTFHAIGHAELAGFRFTPLDRVWVLSYSRNPDDNARLLQHLAQADVAQIVYLSSSSTIVAAQTDCYEYPRIKRQAAELALRLPNARVVTVGLMYADPGELPAGANIATSYAELAQAMEVPLWAPECARQQTLFSRVDRPFGSALEQALFNGYAWLMARCGRHPCLLRPLDLLLRSLRMPWYGYTFLANKLWISKTS